MATLDERIIPLLAQGLSQRAVARIARVGRQTIADRLADPAFAARLLRECREASREAGRYLARKRLRAARVLWELTGKDVPAPVRLGAARAILEAGAQAVEIEALRQEVEELKALAKGEA